MLAASVMKHLLFSLLILVGSSAWASDFTPGLHDDGSWTACGPVTIIATRDNPNGYQFSDDTLLVFRIELGVPAAIVVDGKLINTISFGSVISKQEPNAFTWQNLLERAARKEIGICVNGSSRNQVRDIQITSESL